MTAEPEPPTAPTASPVQDIPTLDLIERLGEHGLEEVLQTLGLAIYFLDETGSITWCSSGFLRMTGYPLHEILGRPRTDLIHGPFLHSEGCRELRKKLTGIQRTRTEFVTRSRSGTSYWTSLEASPMTGAGRPHGMIVVERDITEQRKIEEHGRQTLTRAHSLAVALRHEKHLLSTVLSSIPHLVWWKDLHLCYGGANAAYLQSRGLDSEAAVIGRLEDQLDVVDTLGRQLTELEEGVLTAGEPTGEITTTVRTGTHDDTIPRTLLISVLPHLGNTGELLGTIGVGVDITSRLELERQLAQTSRLEALGQLSAGIAHELNTPVQYVRDNTQFVHDSCTQVLQVLQHVNDLVAPTTAETTPTAPPDADTTSLIRHEMSLIDLEFLRHEVPSALEQSLEGLERVTQIVRAMKDFSHPGTGRNRTDLNRLVETTVQVSRSEWRSIADLEVDLDPDLDPVPCYEGEIKQALLNIVVNAAHAIQESLDGEKGSGRRGKILVRTRKRRDEAEIIVRDDGVGMTDTVKEHIFDPFFTTKEVGRGTGQGLNLAHRTVVGKHSGRLEVRTVLGEGSTFTVLLPLAPPDTTTDTTTAEGTPPP
jgi:two-component system, NtrC family, sensor kinase